MKYLVIEIQSNGDTVSHLFDAFDSENQAYSKYYTVLAAAAVSSIPVHTAILSTEAGEWIEARCFRHPAEPSAE